MLKLTETHITTGMNDLSTGALSGGNKRAFHIVRIISISVELLVWAVREDTGMCVIMMCVYVCVNLMSVCARVNRLWTTALRIACRTAGGNFSVCVQCTEVMHNMCNLEHVPGSPEGKRNASMQVAGMMITIQ